MLYACTSDDDVGTAPRWPVVHLSGLIHVPVCIIISVYVYDNKGGKINLILNAVITMANFLYLLKNTYY